MFETILVIPSAIVLITSTAFLGALFCGWINDDLGGDFPKVRFALFLVVVMATSFSGVLPRIKQGIATATVAHQIAIEGDQSCVVISDDPIVRREVQSKINDRRQQLHFEILVSKDKVSLMKLDFMDKPTGNTTECLTAIAKRSQELQSGLSMLESEMANLEWACDRLGYEVTDLTLDDGTAFITLPFEFRSL